MCVLSGVKLNFVGRADVRWTESHTVTTGSGSNRRTTTQRRTYSDRETYCDEKIYVIGRSGRFIEPYSIYLGLEHLLGQMPLLYVSLASFLIPRGGLSE